MVGVPKSIREPNKKDRHLACPTNNDLARI
jgi:hypothetical protein